MNSSVPISGVDEPGLLRSLAEVRRRNADRLEAGVASNARSRIHRRDMRGTEGLIADLRAEAEILERFARIAQNQTTNENDN